jgi:hypothetical protein
LCAVCFEAGRQPKLSTLNTELHHEEFFMPKRKKTPAKPKPPERRFPRIPSRHSVVLRKLGANPKGELTTTKVVGLGGCSFIHPKPQGVGATLFLSILVGDELGEARVRVAYEEHRLDGTYEIGVEFQEIAPKDLALLERLVETNSPNGI